MPYTPGTERRASSTELMTWATFEEAVAANEASGLADLSYIGKSTKSADEEPSSRVLPLR